MRHIPVQLIIIIIISCVRFIADRLVLACRQLSLASSSELLLSIVITAILECAANHIADSITLVHYHPVIVMQCCTNGFLEF